MGKKQQGVNMVFYFSLASSHHLLWKDVDMEVGDLDGRFYVNASLQLNNVQNPHDITDWFVGIRILIVA